MNSLTNMAGASGGGGVPPGAGAHTHGRNVEPMMPASLGDAVREVDSYIKVAHVELPFHVRRQIVDVDGYDDDYDTDKHELSDARKAAIERIPLGDAALYEDPRAETGRRKLTEAPEEAEAFRQYVWGRQFREHIVERRHESNVAGDRLQRGRAAVETTDEGANVRLAMQRADRSNVFDRISAAARLAPNDAIRDRMLPPATLDEPERVPLALVQQVGTEDACRLVSLDFMPAVSDVERQRFLALPCINTIVRRIRPYLYVPEQFRQHYNIVQLVRTMVSAGCKYHSVSRVQIKERLGEIVDRAFYKGALDYDTRYNRRTLRGGHEHYDERQRRTMLVVVHFYCVLKPKQTKEEKQKKHAERLVGLAAQADKEDADKTRFDPLADLWDDGVDREDDDYTGGNDLQDPASHFIYKCDVVCVEATDCEHPNEALETLPPSAAAVAAAAAVAQRSTDAMYEDDDDGDAPFIARTAPQRPSDSRPNAAAAANTAADDAAKPGVVPDGFGKLSMDSASNLVGKFRKAAFIMNCQGAAPFRPLCIRSVQFRSAEQ